MATTTNERLWENPATSRFTKRISKPLWIMTFIFAFTDILTTWIGITHFGFVESNPFAASLFAEIGVLTAMIVLKGGVTLSAFNVAHFVHEEQEFAIPLALTMVWMFASVSNAVLITIAL